MRQNMSEYKQFQIIVVAVNREDRNDDPITIISNIAIDDESDRGMIRKAIELAIRTIEDEL